MNDFVVKTQNFEGPVEKLLNLIEERKLFISDISLARVTDDYINYIEALEEHDIDGIAEFIVIGSTLVLIKSKSLLPDMDLSEEEEKNIADLEDRLARYKQTRHLAQYVRGSFGTHMSYPREESAQSVYFAPGDNLTKERLHQRMESVLEQLPSIPNRPTAQVEKVERLEDVIDQLRARLQGNMKVRFGDFSNNEPESKKGTIVRFLALLELVKQEVAAAQQQEHFGEIAITAQEIQTPQYHS